MGNCRGCVYVKGDRKEFRRGEDVQMFRCGYAEQEFGGERWVAETLTSNCEAFKSIIPEEGAIEFIRDCKACNGTGTMSGSFTSYSCGGCDGTGKVEMFPNDTE